MKAALLRAAMAVAALFAVLLVLLRTPQPFFSYSARADGLILHSDRPFSTDAAKHVLELSRAKLASSPLYSSLQDHDVFICNSRWRQLVFFNKNYGAGGVAQYPVTASVVLRAALIEDNRLVSPGGTSVSGDRTLDYFIAHEVTHQLTGHALGLLRYYELPRWVREGYADYVGKGNSFSYDEARSAFLAGAPEMDWKKSGRYSRFHLLVTYLLDRQGWSVAQLLENPPSQESVEAAVREEKRLMPAQNSPAVVKP